MPSCGGFQRPIEPHRYERSGIDYIAKPSKTITQYEYDELKKTQQRFEEIECKLRVIGKINIMNRLDHLLKLEEEFKRVVVAEPIAEPKPKRWFGFPIKDKSSNFNKK